MIEDAQRSKLWAAEDAVRSYDSQLSEDRIRDIVAEFDRLHHTGVSVQFIPGDGHVKLFRNTLWVPRWAQRYIHVLHELTHTLISPIFPAHGAEFAARELEVLRALAGPHLAEELERAFNKHHVHHDVAKRQERCRRVIVNYSNKQPGKLLEVVCDNPPELVVGPVGERVGDAVLVGDEAVNFDRLRYVNGLAAVGGNGR